MNPKQSTYHAQALTRGIEILREVAQGKPPGVTLTDLHTATSLPKSTLVRLLAVLEETGLVTRTGDQPRFRVGHGIVPIADSYRRAADIVAVASRHLRSLADTTNQTANLGVIDRFQVRHLCVEEPDRALRFRSSNGSLDELHSTGLGKILLAGLDRDDATQALPAGHLRQMTPNTITQREQLLEDVAAAQRRGYAIDDQEGSIGVRCIAVPLVGDPSAERWGAAISVAGPAAEFEREHIDAHLSALRQSLNDMLDDAEFVATLQLVAGLMDGLHISRPVGETH